MNKPVDVLKNWMYAVNSGDLDALVAPYDASAVVIPIFSDRLLSRPEQIRDYFAKLCSREDLSIALHEKTLIVRPIINHHSSQIPRML